MLVVLSEVECLKTLNNLSVYPDRFYTDLDMFRNEIVLFTDATVVVIFAGSFRFNKRLVINIVKTLMKRVDSEKDAGIKAVYTFSDITLSGLYAYYKYQDTLDKVNVMRGWTVVNEGVFPWTKLQSEKRDCRICLSKFDEGDAEFERKFYTSDARKSSEDEYVRLIVVPDIRNIVQSS